MTDSLSRLRAGLDRDEAIAQAACDAARADSDGDVSRWFVDETEDRASGGVTSGYPQRIVGRPGGANGVVVYDEGYPHLEQARHIARHDPSRALRQAERLREAEVIVRELIEVGDWWTARQGKALAELLAGIYPEDTDETGDAQ